MFTEHTVTTGTITLNLVEGPATGPPLVLLHGGSARWQTWEGLLPAFAARWQVYAVDLRGHGHSAWATSYRLQDYADDVAALLASHIPAPALVCGHSLGGMVALMVAAQAPERVRALVLGDAPLDWRHWRSILQASVDRLIAWRDLAAAQLPLPAIVAALHASPVELPGQPTPRPAHEVFGWDAPWFTGMAQNLSHLDPNTLTLLITDVEQAARGYELAVLLPAIQCPVLLLQADPTQGALMTDADVQHAVAVLAHPTHVQLHGVGHPLHATHPDRVLATIQAFLESVVAGG
jgi:pimeloyl-ACP methyl ester carboxylesterase